MFVLILYLAGLLVPVMLCGAAFVVIGGALQALLYGMEDIGRLAGAIWKGSLLVPIEQRLLGVGLCIVALLPIILLHWWACYITMMSLAIGLAPAGLFKLGEWLKRTWQQRKVTSVSDWDRP